MTPTLPSGGFDKNIIFFRHTHEHTAMLTFLRTLNCLRYKWLKGHIKKYYEIKVANSSSSGIQYSLLQHLPPRYSSYNKVYMYYSSRVGVITPTPFSCPFMLLYLLSMKKVLKRGVYKYQTELNRPFRNSTRFLLKKYWIYFSFFTFTPS